ncbi:uncharacterized protein LOC123665856, partial [Melitaea cinxia]|uniref:uncharacterized protein LOC123665856 n=1 Tax=Melitaea cinxia TaxID=113334 RepID=UPI001E26EEEE
LPISQTDRDGGAVPLWSKSNLDSRRNEYYEFVIKSYDSKEVIENVTCHICDINVPKGYLNEHKKGFRHKFNRKVADTALKRLQLYVNKKDINECNEKLSSKYFCTECSIVIDSEDEKSHKQTTGHRNSLFLERFLKDFLNFYTTEDNEITKDIKTEVVKESQIFEQDVVCDELNVTETVLANRREIIKKEDAEETKDTENYLQDEDAFLEVVDGPNINKFRVTEMCYDAIVVTGATSEYCMICNQMFVRENRLLHVDSKLHGQNLRQKSLDKNCVRKINSTHHHCVLCNDYITEYDLHVNSTDHLTNFRNKIMYKRRKTVQDNDNCNEDKKYDNSTKCSDVRNSDENKSSTGANRNTAPVNKGTRNSPVPSTSSSVAKNSNKTVKLNPNSYLCTVCQVEVPNNVKNITAHKKGISHNQKLRETKAGNNTKVEAKTNLHYQMKKTERLNIVTCIVCNVDLIYNDRNIFKHIEGESHESYYIEFCARNLLVPRDKLLYCYACEVIPGPRNEIAHCSGRNHKFNLEKFDRSR